MALTISKHAKERYAERIMDRESKTDIAVFIRDHDDKIQRDIEKMIEFGALLYEGPTTKDPKRAIAVTVNGQWVVLWDTKEMVVVTLYRVDLGVGDDVNKMFVDNAVAKINAAQEEYLTVSNQTDLAISEYRSKIDECSSSLELYRKRCRDLEALIANYKQMVISANTEKDLALDKVREQVEILIGKQKF